VVWIRFHIMQSFTARQTNDGSSSSVRVTTVDFTDVIHKYIIEDQVILVALTDDPPNSFP